METERDKSLAEYCGYLRAEAAMVDSEEGTDCTTRACLLRGAAEEIERQREHIKMDADLYIKSLNTIVDLEQRLAAAEALLLTACDAWECGQMVTGRDGIVLADYKAACLPRAWYEAAKGGRDGTE